MIRASHFKLCLKSLFLLSAVPTAHALEPQVRKHQTPFSGGYSSYGTSVAMSEQYLVVGDPTPPDLSPTPGNRVHVIDRKTGRITKTLLPPVGLESTRFGAAVAVSGTLAVIGAWQAEETGRAFVYDLRSGRLLHTLAPEEAAGHLSFGAAVAMDGNLIVVGVPAGHEEIVFEPGYVDVFDAKTGAQLFRLEASDAAHLLSFGASVAVVGHIIAIGAPGSSSEQGAVYLFDARTGLQMRKLVAGDGLAGDAFGGSVDLSGGRLLVGAPRGDAPTVANCGTAYLYEVATGNFLREIYPNDPKASCYFGKSVALEGNLAWIGEPYRDDVFTDEGRGYLFEVKTGMELLEWGAADRMDDPAVGSCVAMCGSGLAIAGNGIIHLPVVYEISNLSRVMPMSTVARKGDSAYGASNSFYSAMDHAFINGDGHVAFGARMSGAGASGGRNVGVWNDLSQSQQLIRRTKENDSLRTPAGIISKLAPPVMLNGSVMMLDATFSGPGINGTNNQSLYLDDGTNLTLRHTIGVPVPALGSKVLKRWTDVTQAAFGSGLHAMAVQFQAGEAGVEADSDSGILVADQTTLYDLKMEGDDSGLGVSLGEFTGRIAQSSVRVVFSAMLHGLPSANSAVFKLFPGVSQTKLMRRSDEVALTPGFKPTAEIFLGETIAEDGDALWRVGLKMGREGVTSANNEGLWSDRLGSVELLVRKGDALPGTLGEHLKYKGFLRFWAINGNRVMFLAKITGRGVNSSNDCALFLCQEDGSIMLLMREGDVASESGGAAIGVIQRVEVDTIQGRYAVLCSLVKSTAVSNQALYLGRINSGNATTLSVSRLPHLGLRKGGLFQGDFGTTTQIRSMSLPTTSHDALGAGGKGYSRAINAAGELVLPITFTDRAVHVMRGIP
jgi:hypothetical protein